MKKCNKLISLLLAMTLCCTAFAGCGQKVTVTSEVETSVSTENKETTSTETSGSEAEVKEPLKNADIYPLDYDGSFEVVTYTDPYGDKKYNVYSDAMEKATGIKIDWTYLTAEQLQLALAAKDFPDAVYSFYTKGGILDKASTYEYGKAGYLVNFMDYLDIMPNLAAWLEQYPEMAKMAQNEDGSLYGLPHTDSRPTVQNNVLYFRTDMMKEIGWENPPATTDELLQYCIELQEHFGAKDPEFVAFDGGTASYMAWNSSFFPRYLFPAFGKLLRADFTIHEDKIYFGAATEQYKHYLEFMNELWNSGAFNTNVYTQEKATSQALAANNKVGVLASWNGLAPESFASGEMELIVLEPLTSEYWNEKQFCKDKMLSTGITSVISTKCKDIETMCKWFDAWYATADDPLNEEGTMWGITPSMGELGVNWTIDEATMSSSKIVDENSGPAFQILFNGYKDSLMPYTDLPTNGLGVKGYYVTNNLWPYQVVPIVGKELEMTADEKDLYDRVWTDLNTYLTEKAAKFITGELEISEYWDIYLKDLEQMGLQDVLDMLQEVYDRTH